MPNPLKAARQHMQQEAAHELLGLQAHHLLARVVAVVLPVKADLIVGEVNQAMVGDGNPMRVAAEILEGVLGAAKRAFGVNYPLGMPYRGQVAGEGSRFWPHVCRMAMKPISAPRCFGSAAMVRNVTAVA